MIRSLPTKPPLKNNWLPGRRLNLVPRPNEELGCEKERRRKDFSGRGNLQGKPPWDRELYTPLKVPRTEVDVCKEKEGYLSHLPSIKAPPEKRNRNKYCGYHGHHGHDIEECNHLKNVIERLIKRGHCTRFDVMTTWILAWIVVFTIATYVFFWAHKFS